MMKVIIFGAGGMGRGIYEDIKTTAEVIEFWDNGAEPDQKVGNVPVRKPTFAASNLCDRIILGACYPSMKKQLLDMGIHESKIDEKYVDRRIAPRISFLKNWAEMAKDKGGACAEAGVFQGEFAQYINKFFPDKKLYLFDSFESFDGRDIEVEKNNKFSANSYAGQYANTTEKCVLEKMTTPNNVVLCKGWFPDTLGLVPEDEKFVFVNLDMDLYQPTIAGLRAFAPVIVGGGIILVHDYFSHYTGVKQAVSEFIDDNKNLSIIPIGDEISVAIIGFR